MKMKTNVKAGGRTLVAKGLKVQTKVRAGARGFQNSNETLVAKGLKVKTRVRAGARGFGNHNETLVASA